VSNVHTMPCFTLWVLGVTARFTYLDEHDEGSVNPTRRQGTRLSLKRSAFGRDGDGGGWWSERAASAYYKCLPLAARLPRASRFEGCGLHGQRAPVPVLMGAAHARPPVRQRLCGRWLRARRCVRRANGNGWRGP
jgi:hypothetical protein